MKIRIATYEDLPQISSLCSEQFNVMTSLQPYFWQSGEQDKEFLKSIIDNLDSELWVVEDLNNIVGFLSIFEKKTPEFSFKVQRKYAYIMDIIVTKEYNGKGIASKLMKTAKQWALDRNLDYVELSVLANNSAVEFYKNNDFEETEKTMVCKLQKNKPMVK